MDFITLLLSATLFFYSPSEKDGMHVAEITDSTNEYIGQVFTSDYSNWGQQKRMYTPFISAVEEGYVAVFTVNDKAPCIAIAWSDDLFTWRPQDYPRMSVNGCFAPVIVGKDILFKTADGNVRKTTTTDNFRHFTPDVAASQEEYEAAYNEKAKKTSKTVNGKEYEGQTIDVTEEQINAMKAYFIRVNALNEAAKEKLSDDPERYANIMGTTLKATLDIDGKTQKDISDMLMGIFFEDISYAADGGLYAELIQNRDFEYNAADQKGWTSTTSWRATSGEMKVYTDKPLSKNNPHYIMLTSDTIYNSGWDGISLKEGEAYDFCFYACTDAKKTFTISLIESGNTLATTTIRTDVSDGTWTKYEAVLSPSAAAKKAELMIASSDNVEAALDMISLFPQNTFNGHKNGLRKDLAQTIADLHPKFVRFPGGCMSHGDGLSNIYRWSETIGPLQDRIPDRNIWKYHQTRGLGFYEYFLFCEDIAAEPLPVLAAGVPCQNSKPDTDFYGGQQGGIPEEEMDSYIDEILSLIEWANGDPETSTWAKKRADAGHPAPFNLKYIGIGNEDIISTTFEDRCARICRAIREKYPEIIICGTVGPFHYPSSDYIEGWKYAVANADVFDLVDEHYYESVGWFINNQDYYDAYDRTAPKVYLGEYAARQGKGDIDCALAEALYLTNIERNGDVVSMTSYAPMLSKNGHSNWSPDMIYFSNERITLTPSYHTQRLFSTYSGDKYIKSTLSIDSLLAKRVKASVVKNAGTGQCFLKLVNALPAEVEITVNAHAIPIANVVRYEGFSGEQGQTSVGIESGAVKKNSDGTLTIILPAYSLRVIML